MAQIGILTKTAEIVFQYANGDWCRMTRSRDFRVRATKGFIRDGAARSTKERSESKYCPKAWTPGRRVTTTFKRIRAPYVPRTYHAIRRHAIAEANEKARVAMRSRAA